MPEIQIAEVGRFQAREHSRPARTWLLAIATSISLGLSGFLLYRDVRREARSVRAEPREITARGNLAEDERSSIELFEKSGRSVVFITSAAFRTGSFGLNVTEVPQGTGSGFVWDTAGHIVTNYHVIHNSDAIHVTLFD